MAEIKTQATKESVTAFLKTIEPIQKQLDSFELLKIFTEATGEKPVMWGSNIIGFGNYINKTASSEYDWFHIGFSPRKQNLTLYLSGWEKADPKLLGKLGKYKNSSGGCVYIARLSDVDEKALAKLIKDIYTSRKKIHQK